MRTHVSPDSKETEETVKHAKGKQNNHELKWFTFVRNGTKGGMKGKSKILKKY